MCSSPAIASGTGAIIRSRPIFHRDSHWLPQHHIRPMSTAYRPLLWCRLLRAGANNRGHRRSRRTLTAIAALQARMPAPRSLSCSPAPDSPFLSVAATMIPCHSKVCRSLDHPFLCNATPLQLAVPVQPLKFNLEEHQLISGRDTIASPRPTQFSRLRQSGVTILLRGTTIRSCMPCMPARGRLHFQLLRRKSGDGDFPK